MALGVSEWPLVACQRDAGHGFHPIVEACRCCGQRYWVSRAPRLEGKIRYAGYEVTGDLEYLDGSYNGMPGSLTFYVAVPGMRSKTYAEITNPKDILTLRKKT